MSSKERRAELARQAAAAAETASTEIAKAAKATRRLLFGDPAAEFEEAFRPPEEEETPEPAERTQARRTWRERLASLRRKP